MINISIITLAAIEVMLIIIHVFQFDLKSMVVDVHLLQEQIRSAQEDGESLEIRLTC